MNRSKVDPIWIASLVLCLLPAALTQADSHERSEKEFQPLFDGETLDGWEGNEKFFRVEDGAIIAGRLDRKIRHNHYLCTERSFGDFELRLEVKLPSGKGNSGIQFRSHRLEDPHEVRGYQADVGPGWWGKLYDEARRRKVLAGPDEATLEEALKPAGWNRYRIRCNGDRVRLWLNGVKTVDYTEPRKDLVDQGHICLQIHSGAPREAHFRNIRIKTIE